MNDIKIARKLISTKDSANKRGFKFDISFRKMKQLMLRKTCYYTGVKFDNHTNIRSIDRVDSSIGYIDSNIIVCTSIVNSFKSNLSPKEINMMVKRINEFTEKQKLVLHQ